MVWTGIFGNVRGTWFLSDNVFGKRDQHESPIMGNENAVKVWKLYNYIKLLELAGNVLSCKTSFSHEFLDET